MLVCEVHLPPEIVEMIFEQLEVDEVAVCSGVNTWWYKAAQRFLARITGTRIYRWPDAPSSQDEDVCLAGNFSSKHFHGMELEKLRRLELLNDEPAQVTDEWLKEIFTSYTELNKLELINLTNLGKHQLERILQQCRPGLQFRLSLFHRDKGSNGIMDLLAEHRELFKEIVVEFDNSTTVFGWYPVRYEGSIFRLKPTTRSVTLNCPGLTRIQCTNFNNIKYLELEHCSGLFEMDLLTISKMELITLKIDRFTASESVWITSFTSGFSFLKSLSMTNNRDVTDTVIEALSRKHLEKLTMDIRKGASETTGLPHLYGLVDLVYLHIVADQVRTNALVDGVKTRWPHLVSLRVEESMFNYDESNRTIDLLKCTVESRPDIKFTHVVNCSKLRENTIMKTSDL